MKTDKPASIDAYIATFPGETQQALEQIRAKVKEMVPEAEEVISYAIPAFNIDGQTLVYFAGYKTHIGFYPAPSGNDAFKKAFAGYKTGKGSIQFPLDKPMPLDLVAKIVKFRLKVTAEKAAKKKKKKK